MGVGRVEDETFVALLRNALDFTAVLIGLRSEEGGLGGSFPEPTEENLGVDHGLGLVVAERDVLADERDGFEGGTREEVSTFGNTDDFEFSVAFGRDGNGLGRADVKAADRDALVTGKIDLRILRILGRLGFDDGVVGIQVRNATAGEFSPRDVAALFSDEVAVEVAEVGEMEILKLLDVGEGVVARKGGVVDDAFIVLEELAEVGQRVVWPSVLTRRPTDV